jgi:transposase
VVKELSDVERAFASLKDIIGMRPIYHRTDGLAEAHVFVAALAFLLHRAVEKKLRGGRASRSLRHRGADRAQVRAHGRHRARRWHTKRSVTHGSQRAATVLRALGITELDPPTPPQRGETVSQYPL